MDDPWGYGSEQVPARPWPVHSQIYAYSACYLAGIGRAWPIWAQTRIAQIRGMLHIRDIRYTACMAMYIGCIGCIHGYIHGYTAYIRVYR